MVNAWPPDLPIGDVLSLTQALLATSFVTGLVMLLGAALLAPVVLSSFLRMFTQFFGR